MIPQDFIGKNIPDAIINERFLTKSNILFVMRDEKSGKIKNIWLQPNTFTQWGDSLVADAMSDRGETLPTHMAVGTGTGGKTTASTALEAEVGRVALTSTTKGTGSDDNDVIYIATFPAGTGTGALVEAGLFNDATVGDMMSYSDYSVKTKGAGDAMTVTWTASFGAS